MLRHVLFIACSLNCVNDRLNHGQGKATKKRIIRPSRLRMRGFREILMYFVSHEGTREQCNVAGTHQLPQHVSCHAVSSCHGTTVHARALVDFTVSAYLDHTGRGSWLRLL